jgi:hypothetical protein
MSPATMRENIKAEVDHLDPAALQSIWEIIDRAKRQPAAVPQPAVGSVPNRAGKAAASSPPLKFVGENLTLEEYEKLSVNERRILARRLKEQNHLWLQTTFSALGAAWLVVVDGQVIASGKSLKDQPMQPQIRELCQHTGKFPFVFINDNFITIEESTSVWQETNDPGDFYPSLPVSMGSSFGAAKIIGDFDTGAARTFIDYGFLLAQNVIQPELEDAYETSRHLGHDFDYVTKMLRVKVASDASTTHTVEAKVYCVFDWRLSPFIVINPSRIALIGRDILLELKPKVLLDFEKRQTEIKTSVKPSRARRKSAGRKNSSTRSQRRR